MKVPSCREILKASKEQRLSRLDKKVVASPPKLFQGQEFTGYTSAVSTIQEANIVIAKIKSIHTDARHIICACRIPGRDFHTCQDFIDDDEHGGGAYLLDLLVTAEIQNRLILVVCRYNGEHIGDKHFSLMFDAVKSAVDRSPINEITKKNDCIWSFNTKAGAVVGPKEAHQGAAMGPSVRGSRTRGRGSHQYGHRSGSNWNYAEVVAKENVSSRQGAVGNYGEMQLNGRLKVDAAGRDKEEGQRITQTAYAKMSGPQIHRKRLQELIDMCSSRHKL